MGGQKEQKIGHSVLLCPRGYVLDALIASLKTLLTFADVVVYCCHFSLASLV